MDINNRNNLLPQEFKSGLGTDKAVAGGESVPQPGDREVTQPSPREEQRRATVPPAKGFRLWGCSVISGDCRMPNPAVDAPAVMATTGQRV